MAAISCRKLFCLIFTGLVQSLYFFSLFTQKYYFEIYLVADNDHGSRLSKTEFQSTFAKLSLSLSKDPTKHRLVNLNINSFQNLSSKAIEGAENLSRFMELSSLAIFNGDLITCDDRTGKIMKVDKKKSLVYLWVDLGKEFDPNFKCEWLTVKDEKLYAGSFGKVFSDPHTGETIHSKFLKVYRINRDGIAEQLDWKDNYEKVQVALNNVQGFSIHEAVEWNDQMKSWIILPRKVSPLNYTEARDMQASANFLIVCSEDFENISVIEICHRLESKGFSDVSHIAIDLENTPNILREDLYFVTKTFENPDGLFFSYLAVISCKAKLESVVHKAGSLKKSSIFENYECREIVEHPLPNNDKFEGIQVVRLQNPAKIFLAWLKDLIAYLKI